MEKNLSTHWIEKELLRRKEANPKYSLRSYANFLGVPPGRLSEILSGKRKLSRKLSNTIADRLCLSPEQRRYFESQDQSKDLSTQYHLVNEDVFSLIADWYHTAFLALMDTKNFQPNPNWIAKRLNISTIEVRAMLQRLERSGLIQKSPKGWKKTHNNLKTADGISSAALRKSHKTTLMQAIESLENDPVSMRDISSITMAIDPNKLDLVRPLLKEFRRKICDLLESKTSTEVYNFNLQLVPVTRKEKS
jgi:uncharacterized protein (TIGR02147 family)